MVVAVSRGWSRGWLRESDSQDRLRRFQQQTWQVALIDWIDGAGGEGEREGGSASQIPGWLNWLLNEVSTRTGGFANHVTLPVNLHRP